MFYQTPIKSAAVALVAAGLIVYAIFGGYFAREIVIEIALLAMIAIALDFIAGYGGMISLCHGAIYGMGAYIFGSLTATAAHWCRGCPSATGRGSSAATFRWTRSGRYTTGGGPRATTANWS